MLSQQIEAFLKHKKLYQDHSITSMFYNVICTEVYAGELFTCITLILQTLKHIEDQRSTVPKI